jgi:hypothetical protein
MDQTPRDLHADERALLDHLLAVDEPRFEQLREQAKHATVVESEAGLICLAVPRTVSGVAVRPGPVVSRATTGVFEDGKWADVFLWITREDGYLECIEIMWPDGALDRLPTPDELGPAVAMQHP